MELPETIKVGNVTYRVVRKTMKNDLGRHRVKNNPKIVISEGLQEDLLRNTFFHELVHAILYQIGSPAYRDELLVQSLANELDKLFELK